MPEGEPNNILRPEFGSRFQDVFRHEREEHAESPNAKAMWRAVKIRQFLFDIGAPATSETLALRQDLVRDMDIPATSERLLTARREEVLAHPSYFIALCDHLYFLLRGKYPDPISTDPRSLQPHLWVPPQEGNDED